MKICVIENNNVYSIKKSIEKIDSAYQVVCDKEDIQNCDIVVIDDVLLYGNTIENLDCNKIFVVNRDDKNCSKDFLAKFDKVLTYGMSSDACVTASSTTEENVQLCIQEAFVDINGKIKHEKEFGVKISPENKCGNNSEKIGVLLAMTSVAVCCDVELGEFINLV